MGRIPRESVLSNGLMIKRGYTSEHYIGEFIIYGNLYWPQKVRQLI